MDAIRVLVVEDNPGDAALLRRYLNAGRSSYEITNVERIVDALEELRNESVDIVLLDLSLPDSQGIATFNEVRVRRPDLPIVVLSGLDDEEVATEAVKAGAQDYLVKGTFDAEVIGRAVRYAIERNRMQRELQTLALTDEVTGMLNARGFQPVAEQQIRLAERDGTEVSILFLDVDGLKRVNDEHGHPAGTTLIASAAEAIRAAIRRTDVPARVGGDEFCVIVTGGGLAVGRILARLAEVVTEHNASSRSPYPLSLSVGTAVSTPEDRRSLDTLIGEADEHMYEDKRARHLERHPA